MTTGSRLGSLMVVMALLNSNYEGRPGFGVSCV